VTEPATELPEVPSTWLRPYASFLVLRCVGEDRPAAFRLLLDFMKRPRSSRAGTSWAIVASGFGEISSFLREEGTGADGLDELDGIIHQKQSPPSWAAIDSEYTEVHYSLAIALRRQELIALHCDAALRDAVQKWLDRPPRPPLMRVPPEVLQGAFLTGEAKNLWLRGTHARRTTKADSKNLSGQKLQDALSPFEDSSFAMSTARAALPDDPGRTALTGNVGTTPRRALVWNRPTPDFADFVAAVIDALDMVADTIASGATLDRPYPLLATESNDLSKVYGAYDVAALGPGDLPGIDISEELLEAAETLQRAVFAVRPLPDSADLVLNVGLDGAFGGSLRVVVKPGGEGVEFIIGFDSDSQPTNLAVVREVKDALDYSAELLTVYYDSGHMIDGRSIWSREVRTVPFPRWNFLDFTGFDISREKPPGRSPDQIHAAIGIGRDPSLFHWVVRQYSTGWLTCDDGAGEVADFVHISQEGILSLIHVKGAGSTGPSRRIAVGSYEVVASQAAKNFINLESVTLRNRLAAPAGLRRATWTDGIRVDDRSEFLDSLDLRDSADAARVVIVQPHISRPMYDALRRPGGVPAAAEDYYRLNLLETLLNTIRGSVTSLGADMDVIGSES
jgi:hypothetical protein